MQHADHFTIAPMKEKVLEETKFQKQTLKTILKSMKKILKSLKISKNLGNLSNDENEIEKGQVKLRLISLILQFFPI